MERAEWTSLYISVPFALKKRITAAAQQDGRTVAKCVELILADHFKRLDHLDKVEPECKSITLLPDTSVSSSE